MGSNHLFGKFSKSYKMNQFTCFTAILQALYSSHSLRLIFPQTISQIVLYKKLTAQLLFSGWNTNHPTQCLVGKTCSIFKLQFKYWKVKQGVVNSNSIFGKLTKSIFGSHWTNDLDYVCNSKLKSVWRLHCIAQLWHELKELWKSRLHCCFKSSK